MKTTSSSYLAFDLGASSGRAVLGTLEAGRMRMEEVHRFDTPIVETDGRLQWDLEVLWQELQKGLRAALERNPKLKSLSVDSWAVDYVPLGEEGEPLRNPYCYRDARTEGVMEQVFEQVPAADIFQITGVQFLSFNTLYQLIADQKQEPARVRRTRLHLTIADYFNYRFGRRPVIERSMASTTQLMGARSGAWATELMKPLGIDPNMWPEIVPSGTKLGPVSTVDGKSTIEVVAGCSHDTACAVAAVPAEEPPPGEGPARWAYVSCGTWSLLGVERMNPILTDEARKAGFTNETGSGKTIRFLRNLTGLWPLQECVREWREAGDAVDYDTLIAQAAAAPRSPTRIDLEDDRFLARGGMEARLLGYCRETSQPVPPSRGQLVRVILESIAESYRRALDDLEAVTGTPIETLHVVGGGARNDLLCQLAAQATGCRVVAGPVEATALGNLALQAKAMGDLPEGTSVRDMVRRSTHPKTHTPDPYHRLS